MHSATPASVELPKTGESAVACSVLLGVSDETLIAHACRWMANETETGNGSVSAEDRRDTKARIIRAGMDVCGFPENRELTPHDVEYVRRLRAIVKRLETHNDQAHTPRANER